MKKVLILNTSVKRLFLLAVFFVSIVPLLFMIVTSMKSSQDLYTIPVYQLPEVFHIENYGKVFEGNFFQYLNNSLLVVMRL